MRISRLFWICCLLVLSVPVDSKDIIEPWAATKVMLDGLGGQYQIDSFTAKRGKGTIEMQASLVPVYIPMAKLPTAMVQRLGTLNKDLKLMLNKDSAMFVAGLQISFNATDRVIGESIIQLVLRDIKGNEVLFHRQTSGFPNRQVVFDVVPTFAHMWQGIEGELTIVVQLLDENEEEILSIDLPTIGQKMAVKGFMQYLRHQGRDVLKVDR